MSTKTTAPTAKKVNGNALLRDFKAARRAGVPLIAIESPDAAATMAMLATAVKAECDDFVVGAWDVARGLRGLDKVSIAKFAQLGIDALSTCNPMEALNRLKDLPEDGAVFFHNLHFQFDKPHHVQAVWNLRDDFKVNGRMFVMIGTAFKVPPALANDVIPLNEPLPTRAELLTVVREQFINAKESDATIVVPKDDEMSPALDAVVGLARFTAEQYTAMSLTRGSLDLDALWQRKVAAIESTDGLRVHKGGVSMDELQGIDNAVEFMNELIDADAFKVVVFIDEGEKAFAGGMSEHVGDNGVGRDQVGQILTYMQETKSLGVMLAGVTGCGKSALASAVAAKAGKVCISLDLGGLKGSYQGQSEQNLRNALKVITATAEGRVLFIMTANNTALFTPEMTARFPDQFFFDLPNAAARAAMWKVHAKRNGLTDAQVGNPSTFDKGWNGREIERACVRAALLTKTVEDAARFIVPASVSSKSVIEDQRTRAAGKFLSAHKPGLYEVETTKEQTVQAGQRRIRATVEH
jgi:hypothetical protein